MKNTLGDLQNHLFAQLERLGEEEIEGDKLQEEISRARAVSDLASKIISNGALVLEGHKFMDDRMNADKKLPKMLEGDNK